MLAPVRNEWTIETVTLAVTEFVQCVTLQQSEDDPPPDDPLPPRAQGPPHKAVKETFIHFFKET